MEIAMNFKEQAQNFLKHAATRKRKPFKAATIRKYEASLEHAISLFGNRDLSEINNNALKTLVAKLSADGLSASTITGVVVVVKLVVASAVNDQGDEIYPRTWNHEFMDLPEIHVNDQKRPRMAPEQVTGAISRINGQYKALCVLLAGTGLRIGEALVLTSEDWDRQNMTISVTKTAVGTEVQGCTKTQAGNRVVDLAPELNAFLIQTLGDVQGLLFKSSTGGVIQYAVAHAHAHEAGIPGFHSLRRFRTTHLNRMNCPSGLERFWIGHAMSGAHERYIGFQGEVTARKAEVSRIGLGFSL